MLIAHLTTDQLQAGLEKLGHSPQDRGTLEMIVGRPAIGERRILERAELDMTRGLVGDNWQTRGSKHTEDGNADPLRQITIMNSRIIQLVAQDRVNWPLAGDQLYIDLDLSMDNLKPGQQIIIGTAHLEITAIPHNGCDKFTARFGHDAIRLVNSEQGRQARYRGIYARVIQSGVICAGDIVSKVGQP